MEDVSIEVVPSRESDEEDIEKISRIGKESGIEIDKSENTIVRNAADSLPPIVILSIEFLGEVFAVWVMNKGFDKMWEKLSEVIDNSKSENIDSSFSQIRIKKEDGTIGAMLRSDVSKRKQINLLSKYLKENPNTTGSLHFDSDNQKWLKTQEVMENSLGEENDG